jgi:hypothetical protein
MSPGSDPGTKASGLRVALVPRLKAEGVKKGVWIVSGHVIPAFAGMTPLIYKEKGR